MGIGKRGRRFPGQGWRPARIRHCPEAMKGAIGTVASGGKEGATCGCGSSEVGAGGSHWGSAPAPDMEDAEAPGQLGA